MPENDPTRDIADLVPNVEAERPAPVINPEGKTDAAKDAAEKLPELKLKAAARCQNKIPGSEKAPYVGLNAEQRRVLGVELGGRVDLFDATGTSLGRFTVGPGTKFVYDADPEAFTANIIDLNQVVTVKKAPAEDATDRSYKVAHGVEAKDKTGRVQKIAARFPELSPTSYLVIPTELGKALDFPSSGKATILMISKAKIRVGRKEMEIPMVPAGSEIGFTTEAAKALGIPETLNEIRVRVVDGVLVIA